MLLCGRQTAPHSRALYLLPPAQRAGSEVSIKLTSFSWEHPSPPPPLPPSRSPCLLHPAMFRELNIRTVILVSKNIMEGNRLLRLERVTEATQLLCCLSPPVSLPFFRKKKKEIPNFNCRFLSDLSFVSHCCHLTGQQWGDF